MIIGTGIDIVEIDRIQNIIEKWGKYFLKKIYTQHEIKDCEQKKIYRFQSYAGYFAAKEAWTKAMGTGMRGVKWQEIEIRKDTYGKPFLNLSGQAQQFSSIKGVTNITLSISHIKKIAIAQVIIEN